MLQDKRKDLDSERQKRLLDRLVAELSRTELDFYYRSTSDVAVMLMAHIKKGAQLSPEDRGLLQRLNRRDIEVILSLKSDGRAR